MLKIATITSRFWFKIIQVAVIIIYAATICSSCAALQKIKLNLESGSNAWSYLRSGFNLTADPQQPAIKQQLQWLRRHPRYLQIRMQNAKHYLYYVVKQTKQRNIPTEVALMPIIESGFNPLLISQAGAAGLWQLMPGTATGFGLEINWWYDARRDIVQSTKAALNYLDYLHGLFGSWPLAIAAYDSGEGTVLKALRYNLARQRPSDIWALKLPKETRSYVARLLAMQIMINNPEHYKINLPRIDAKPTFQTVTIKQQISLPLLARLSACNLKTLSTFNPGYRREIITKNSQVLIPMECLSSFNKNRIYANTKWVHYKVKSGDTMSGLAARYHSSIKAIITANKLKNSNLRIGQPLMIPNLLEHGSALSSLNFMHNPFAEDHAPGPKQIIYITKHGDSLWSIAKKFGVRTSEIRYWNKLPRHLKPGTKIIIWITPKPQTTISYKIKPGDTLSAIALKAKITSKRLMQLNKMHSTLLRAGQKIKVPKV